MTEKKDLEEEVEEGRRRRRRKRPSACQALYSRRVYTPWAPFAAAEHHRAAKATPRDSNG